MNWNRILKIVLVIIGLGLLSKNFYYRKWLGYENIPGTKIFDERDYPFIGYTFRKTGIPTGWSNMNIYKILADEKQHTSLGFNGLSITADGQSPTLKNRGLFNYPVYRVTDVDIGKGTETIILYQPFFDHPIFGSWLYSWGVTNQPKKFDDLDPAEYRRVALILSTITGILIFAATWGLYRNLITALIAMVIYSTVPNLVIMSRLALLENILIPLSLLNIFLISLLPQTNKPKKLKTGLLIAAGVVSGLAFLTKEQGIYVLIIGLVGCFGKVKLKELWQYLLPFGVVTLIYYGYALYLAPDLIIKLLFDQAGRGFFGPLAYLYSITGPRFSQFPVEGYWLWGLVALAGMAYRDFSKHRVVIAGYVVYLLVFMFVGSGNYAWYTIPFLPFLVIAMAVFVWDLITRPDIFKIAIFLALPFASSFYWGYVVFKSGNVINIYRGIIGLFLIAGATTLIKSTFFKNEILKKILQKKILWIVFVILIGYQINKWNWQSFLYITANWSRLPESFQIK